MSMSVHDAGSEVGLALVAPDLLAKDGIDARVVSMPCCELFRAQPQETRHALGFTPENVADHVCRLVKR